RNGTAPCRTGSSPPDPPISQASTAALIARMGPIDGQAVIAYVCTVDVADLDQTLQAVTANGGSIALPRMPIPGVGWLAYAKDTEGNIFGVMQPEMTAK